MISLDLPPTNKEFHVLALGAHPDDIEIGCGGTLLRLAKAYLSSLHLHVSVLTSTPARAREAEEGAHRFAPGAKVSVETYGLVDGYLPAQWADAKEALEDLARRVSPQLILTPNAHDAHQDHRTVAEIAGTVWRDHLVLGYEIPKYDGDVSRPSVYVPLSDDVMSTKCQLLRECFPSQAERGWFDDELFCGIARLRGIECRSHYAEAFHLSKAILGLADAERHTGHSSASTPMSSRDPWISSR